ncbi:tRNA (adenosine(37)-N6)-threonylcarbamoyltransferase complex ATPase subunit type 1 TsaE [Planctomycetales bacterium ZRK34]|nr:tRNA (adenosine(37)-N6)-threonylcarbamoyltransferase complex ATPase subunit type 1 TsaE [Planctomycetales bacterium ZRK34]
MNDQAVQPITWTSPSVQKTQQFGQHLASLCDGGEVIALVGSLGAGKTQLVRGLAEGLGVDPLSVSSPTFVLMCEYSGGRLPVVHIDAYRMQGLSDLESIGWSAQLFEGAVTAVEWADHIEDELPADHLRIEIDHADEDRRGFTMTLCGDWRDRYAKLNRIIADLRDTRPCPSCGSSVDDAVPTFPFCSSRCKMADLNKWFSGDYSISRPLTAEDDELDV